MTSISDCFNVKTLLRSRSLRIHSLSTPKLSRFGISVNQLNELMSYRDNEAIEKFLKLGSIDGLCRKLDLDPNQGLFIVVLNL